MPNPAADYMDVSLAFLDVANNFQSANFADEEKDRRYYLCAALKELERARALVKLLIKDKDKNGY